MFFEDLFFDELDEMMFIASVLEDDEETEYIDFDYMTDEEMEQFYK